MLILWSPCQATITDAPLASLIGEGRTLVCLRSALTEAAQGTQHGLPLLTAWSPGYFSTIGYGEENSSLRMTQLLLFPAKHMLKRELKEAPGGVGVGEGKPAVVRFSVLSFCLCQPATPLTPTSCSKCAQTSRAEKGSVARVHLHQALDHDRILQVHFSECQILPDCSWRELFAAFHCLASS